MKTVEITEVHQLKGAGLFKSFMGGIRIIPDPSVKNGYKKVKGDNIFISPMNYKDIKGCEAEGVLIALSILKEIKD